MKNPTQLLAAAFVLISCLSAGADPAVYEGFNYYSATNNAPLTAPASLYSVGLTGSYASAIVGNASINYTTNSLSFSPYFFPIRNDAGAIQISCNPTSSTVNEGATMGIPLNAGTLTGTVYGSCLFNLSSSNMSVDWDAIGVKLASGQTNGSASRLGMFPKDTNSGTRVCVQYANGSGGEVTTGTTVPTVGTTYFLVAKWTNVGGAGGGTATMWLLTAANYQSWVTTGLAQESALATYATGTTSQTATTQVTFDNSSYLEFTVGEGTTNNTGSITGKFTEIRMGTSLESVAFQVPKIGVFPNNQTGYVTSETLGSGAGASVFQYEQWLGTPVDYIMQFPGVQSWADLDNNADNGLGYWVNHWSTFPPSVRNRITITLPMLFSGDSLATGATGAYNSYWQTAATHLVTAGYGNALMRIGAEFYYNGSHNPWNVVSGQQANFVAYWQQIVTTMRSVPGAHFKFIWNPTLTYSPYDPSTAYPGNAYVDYIGLDIYDNNASSSYRYSTTGYPNSLTPAQDLQIQQWAWQDIYSTTATSHYSLTWWINFANSKGVPLCFPEWGLANVQPPGSSNGWGGQDNNYFLQQMYSVITNPLNHVAFADYFEFKDGSQQNAIDSGLFFADEFPVCKAAYPGLFGLQYFSGNFAGGSSSAWSQGSTAPWSTVSQSTPTNGNIYYAYQAAQSTTLDPISTAGSASWTDYQVALGIKVTAATAPGGTYLYGRYTDANNNYAVKLEQTATGTDIALIKTVGGTATTLGTATTSSAAWATNIWYNLSLQMVGGQLSVSFDGTPMLAVTDTAPLTSGMIGLSAQNQAALFKNVVVTPPVNF